MFFGFTHCRVVCPRALGRISAALDSIGDIADQLTPLYISVDPDRDTPAVMKAFLESKYPRFTGLTGTRAQTDAAKKTFRVFAQRKEDTAEPDGYAVPHIAFTYLLDRKGGYLIHFPDTINEMELAAGLKKFIAC